MDEVKKQLVTYITQAVSQLGGENVVVSLERPTDITHGDYTTNVAFGLSKTLKKAPLAIAEEIAHKLSEIHGELIAKVEAVRPGFLNIWLSQEFLSTYLNQLITDPKKATTTTKMKDKKISVEFTDPNPFKEFHIGHLYTNTVGESLARIFEASGALVWRADYFGDVGMHVAKALWGLEAMFAKDNKNMGTLATESLQERIQYFGKAYAKGATAYEEDEKAKEEMKVLNKLIYLAAQRMWEKEKGLTPQIDYTQGETVDEARLQEVYDMYSLGRKWSLEYFDSIYERVGMKFAGYYPESIAGERGYKLVKEHISDGTFVEHEGAVIFPGKEYGLHNRVFINSLGLPTYEAKELGLAPWKYEDFQYDRSIILTGNEINEYFKVLIKALTLIKPEIGSKTEHVGHGMVRLPEGKMSSRTGKIVSGQWLLDEAVKKAGELSKEGSQDTQTAEQVGIGAVKYAFLKSSIGKDVEFDFDTSLSLNGNSGPYLQYTYVRTQSIAQKAIGAQIEAHYPVNYTPSVEETTLLRTLVAYKDVLESAADHLSPSTLATYLYDLAKLYNLFYQNNRIVDAQTKEEKSFRLLLTLGVGIILSAGLALLGIDAPKRM